MTNRWQRSMRVGVILGVFGVGCLCGTISERRAMADMKSLGGAVAQEAAGGGGALGQAAKLGTAITDMQSQVDGLQKNLETLKVIKSALGG